jgi:hypothetical protein
LLHGRIVIARETDLVRQLEEMSHHSLLSTLALTIMSRGEGRRFAFGLTALLCIVGTQVVFWVFTYPANKQTNNWTVLPPNWQALRFQWEYSHATSAILNLIALVSVILAVIDTHRAAS